ncbi:hypothetical protein Q1M63_01235 (plasmid) [Sinorhizobium meliloti]|nr:hypothetical protein Q1M63_01235 [Sinorhizobium meliloti]
MTEVGVVGHHEAEGTIRISNVTLYEESVHLARWQFGDRQRR